MTANLSVDNLTLRGHEEAPAALDGRRVLKYRPELDAIRGIAVLLVVFQHFGLLVGHRAGQVGVTLFFVLSGYLITSLLEHERRETGRIDLRRFYVRRARRLWPALIFMVVVVVAAGFPGNPLPALTYTANLDVLSDLGSFRHTWTLAVEEQFYLVWPVLFLVLRRWAILPLAVVAFLVYPPSGALAAGVVLALSGVRLPAWVGIGGWLGVVLTTLAPGDTDLAFFAMTTFAAVGVVGAPGPVDRARSLVRLGTVSYGVYLWHFPLAALIQPAQVNVNPALAVVLTMAGVAGSLGMAVVSERFVERRWRLRRGDDARVLSRTGVPGSADHEREQQAPAGHVVVRPRAGEA